MARSQQFITTLALAVHLAGCQTSSSTRGLESSSATQVSDPVPDLWANVRNEIDSLERSGAPLSKWKEASESSERVSTIVRLNEITKPLKTGSELEKSELEKLFSSAPDTYHFGFEGNLHSLVFFDASHQSMKVVKW
jgi:hypothetical protein